jgi:hypothetical protein
LLTLLCTYYDCASDFKSGYEQDNKSYPAAVFLESIIEILNYSMKVLQREKKSKKNDNLVGMCAPRNTGTVARLHH